MNTFNLQKYLGKWCEIAKNPFKWEQGCYNITAEYFITNDKINIINSCDIIKKGVIIPVQSKGSGYLTNNPMIINTTFDNKNMSEYRILYTDYNHSIVGSSDKNKLWILARTKIISNDEYKKLIKIANTIGYSTDNLVISRII